MNFSYRIPLGNALAGLGVWFLIVLGTFGRLGDSFEQTLNAQLLTLLIFIGAVAYLAFVPRNRRVQLSDACLLIPKVLLPPFGEARFTWDEVQDLQETAEGLVFITARGNFKLSKLLCKSDFEFALTPKNYLRARDWARDRWIDIRRVRELRRWHQQNRRHTGRDD